MKSRSYDVWGKVVTLVRVSDANWLAENASFANIYSSPLALLQDAASLQAWLEASYNETFVSLVLDAMSTESKKTACLLNFLWQATSLYHSTEDLITSNASYKISSQLHRGMLCLLTPKPFPNGAQPSDVDFITMGSKRKSAPGSEGHEGGQIHCLADAVGMIPSACMLHRIFTKPDVSGNSVWPDRLGAYKLARGGEGTKGRHVNDLQQCFADFAAASDKAGDYKSDADDSMGTDKDKARDLRTEKLELYRRFTDGMLLWQSSLRRGGTMWLVEDALKIMKADVMRADALIAAGDSSETSVQTISDMKQVKICLDAINLERHFPEEPVTQSAIALQKSCIELTGNFNEKMSEQRLVTALTAFRAASSPTEEQVAEVIESYTHSKNNPSDATAGVLASVVLKLQGHAISCLQHEKSTTTVLSLLREIWKEPKMGLATGLTKVEITNGCKEFDDFITTFDKEKSVYNDLKEALSSQGSSSPDVSQLLAASTNAFEKLQGLFPSMTPDMQASFTSLKESRMSQLTFAVSVYIGNIKEKLGISTNSLKLVMNGGSGGSAWFNTYDNKQEFRAFLDDAAKTFKSKAGPIESSMLHVIKD